jgi:hypothetical protein
VRCLVDRGREVWGRDFGDVSPLRGVILGGADHKLSVTVRVEPVEDAQR